MFSNCCQPMYDVRGQTVSTWGKDQTGKVNYRFNSQGFRGPEYNYTAKYAFFGSAALFGVGVSEEQCLVSQFDSAHNYGLAGTYLNLHSVANLQKFLSSEFYIPETKIIFFWIERPDIENIPQLVNTVNSFGVNVLHISQGEKYPGLINLMPEIDTANCGEQPGIKTHQLWAKTIQLLLQNAKHTDSN